MTNAPVTNASVLDDPLSGAPTRELVERISAALDDPPWLHETRLRALAAYEALDWPSAEAEEWRRTPMEAVPLDGYRTLLEAEAAPAAVLTALARDDASRGGLLLHQDGQATAQQLDPELATQGVLLLPLAQAAREHEELVRPHLHSVVPAERDRFTALSGALWSQGLFCYVPREVRLETSLYHLMGKSAAGQGLFGQTLVVAEPGSALTLVEVAASDDAAAPSLSHRTVEIVAKEDADVRVVTLQRWGADVYAFLTARAHLGRRAHLQLASAAFGAALDKERLEVDAGDASQADLLGLFVGRAAQHLEYNTRQEHAGVGARSELLIKGALTERASAVQYGVIRIEPTGQKTNAFQTMRNLLLSEGASANPIPILEIEADDVQCSHAAAVGPVDPEHVFYLQARCIPEGLANRMVVQGFLQVVVERFPDSPLRALLERLINERLEGVATA